MNTPRSRLLISALAATALCVAAVAPTLGQDADSEPVDGTVTVYTSVTQDTVDAVLAALAAVNPELKVEVFRAPTGELDARIATEQRTGGIAADVLWMTDPLSVQRYEADGLLAPLEGEAFDIVPEAYRGETFVGTRLLNLVLVSGADVEDAPTAWAELAGAEGVVMPDPGFAGSAFAALGYFGTSDEYGLDFYQGLKDNGATIVLFSPVAVVAESDDLEAAQAFQSFLVSPEGQAAIASTGWQPVRDDVEWPHEDTVVTADWDELYGRQAQLLEDFYAIFGD